MSSYALSLDGKHKYDPIFHDEMHGKLNGDLKVYELVGGKDHLLELLGHSIGFVLTQFTV